MSPTQTLNLTELESIPRPVEATTGPDPESTDPILSASLAFDDAAPDGGRRGWTVVCACSTLIFWAVGTQYSWGVIQAALVAQRLSSPSTLAFVGSLSTCWVAVLAVANARLIRLVGARKVGLAGVMLMGFGQVLSGFATGSVGGLFVTNGLVAGIGVSFCFMVASTVPAQYFKQKRGLANGIVYAGGGLGGAVISFVMNALIEKVGPANTYRVLGCINFATALPAAWLIVERVPSRRLSFIDWGLFRDRRFVILFIAGGIATFPVIVPPFFLPLYASSLGLSAQVGTTLVASFNFSSGVGRVMCGLMGDKLGPLNTLFVSLLLSAVSMLSLWPVSESLGPLIAFAIINGVANGGFFAIMPTVVGNVFGSARLSVAMGMIVTAWAGGYLMGAPIAGWLLEAYGGQQAGFRAFRPAIYYAGSMALGSSALVGIARLTTSRKVLKKL